MRVQPAIKQLSSILRSMKLEEDRPEAGEVLEDFIRANNLELAPHFRDRVGANATDKVIAQALIHGTEGQGDKKNYDNIHRWLKLARTFQKEKPQEEDLDWYQARDRLYQSMVVSPCGSMLAFDVDQLIELVSRTKTEQIAFCTRDDVLRYFDTYHLKRVLKTLKQLGRLPASGVWAEIERMGPQAEPVFYLRVRWYVNGNHGGMNLRAMGRSNAATEAQIEIPLCLNEQKQAA